MLDLPRSAVLAAWSVAVCADGRTGAIARAVRSVQGSDEPHTIRWVHDAGPDQELRAADALPSSLTALPDGATLGELLTALAAADVHGLRVVLPAPGDAADLPGPPPFNHLALAAGEALIAAGPPGTPLLGIVPVVHRFGSQWEPGADVVWQLHRVAPHRPPVADLAGADRALRAALLEATEALHELDVARWRPEAASRITAVRSAGVGESRLPGSTPQRAVRILATAARLRAVVDLAHEDDGASVNGWEAQRRSEALRGVDRVARAAVAAASNAELEQLARPA